MSLDKFYRYVTLADVSQVNELHKKLSKYASLDFACESYVFRAGQRILSTLTGVLGLSFPPFIFLSVELGANSYRSVQETRGKLEDRIIALGLSEQFALQMNEVPVTEGRYQ